MTVASTFTILPWRNATSRAASCQKNLARRVLPARVGVREKVADVLLAERAEDGVANRVHERVGVRMAVEAFRVRNLHAAEDELAPGDQ